MARIMFAGPCVANFAVGDRLSTGEMVVAVDHEHGELTTAPATWWRRAWHWCRAQRRHAGWWLRCTWADLRAKNEEP